MGGFATVTVHGTKFEIEYEMTGSADDCELEETIIKVGGSEIAADCLASEVLVKIDEACMEDFWTKGPEGPEPDDMEEFDHDDIPDVK